MIFLKYERKCVTSSIWNFIFLSTKPIIRNDQTDYKQYLVDSQFTYLWIYRIEGIIQTFDSSLEGAARYVSAAGIFYRD